MSSRAALFSEAERRVLAAADQVVDGHHDETPRQREARWSAESRQRRIDRIGLAEFRAIMREKSARSAAKRQGRT